MARPKEIVKKDSKIAVRCTALEKKVIEIMADETGLTTSDYIRKCAMNKVVKIRFSSEELEHFRTLQKFHNNFRSIGNLIKGTKGINEETLKEIKQVREEISEQLKRFNS